MFRQIVILALALFLHQSESMKLPSYFKPCQRDSPDFNECAQRNGQLSVPSLIKGDRKYKIPPLNPLNLPELNINQGENLHIFLKNVKIGGLADSIIEKTDFNFNAKKITINIRFPKLTIDSNYKISGRILVLPISGEGPSALTLNDVSAVYSMDYDYIKKGNDQYLKPKKGHITYKLGGMKVQFDNLFNGDKLLGPETNNFLNENWQEVSKELGPAVAEALAEVINLIIANVTDLVPVNDLFPEKV